MKIQILTIFKQPLAHFASWKRGSLPSSFIIVHFAALFLTVGIYSEAAIAKGEKGKQSSPSTSKTKKPVEDLPNFHQVHPYLYRGGEPTDKGVDKLKSMGVKSIIDLRAPTKMAKAEKKYANKIGLEYINLPMSAKPPTQNQVDTMLSKIDAAKKSNEPVFVHCQHGSDRTGCMIGIWRVKRDGWKFDRTYKEMRKYYFGKKYHQLRNAVKSRSKG